MAASPAVGEVASETTVTLKVRVTALLVSQAEIMTQAETNLASELPGEEPAYEIIPESLTYSIGTIDAESKTATLNTQLTAWVKTNSAINRIDTGQLTGKSVDDAYAYLMSQGIQGAQIELFPRWLPALPLLSNHIVIQAQ